MAANSVSPADPINIQISGRTIRAKISQDWTKKGMIIYLVYPAYVNLFELTTVQWSKWNLKDLGKPKLVARIFHQKYSMIKTLT